MDLNIDKYCLRYGLDNNYHTLCSKCMTDNVISFDVQDNKCGSCGALLEIRRYPASVIPIRGHQISSNVIRDAGGKRVVCGSCGLVIYVKCEGEEFIQCIDCGIQIDYSSFPD